MIKNIKLLNFRKFSNLNLNLNHKRIIIYGDNAIGKTSIIDAIYLLSTSKSFKTNNFLDLINKNEKEAYIELTYNTTTISLGINKTKKIYQINKIECKNIYKFISNFHVVLFVPDDIYIVKDNFSKKRKFIDKELSLINSKYLQAIVSYKKLLKKRNELLKDKNTNKTLFNVITNNLIDYMVVINNERKYFLDKLNYYLDKLTKENNFEIIKLSYKIDLDKKIIKNKFNDSYNQDLIYKQTTYGAHKEEIKILINNLDARYFASEGQSRTIVILLKVALMMYIKEEYNQELVLLLDDIFISLDIVRQEKIFNFINNYQTIITTTQIDNLDEEIKDNSLIINLKENI